MKMNIEIDLDWLTEDGDIESSIKEGLVNQVVDSCLDKLSEMIEKKASSRLDEAIDNHIASILSDLLNRQIRITDKYGDPIKTYENVDEMLDEKFENFLTHPVDRDGKPYTGCSYGDKYTRIEHLITSKITVRSEKESLKIVKDTQAKIDKFFKGALSNAIAEKLFRQIDVESLLKQP